MKKEIFVGILGFAILVVFPTVLLAAPVGNPASPKLLSSKWIQSEEYAIKAGPELDFIFDTELEDTVDCEINFYSGKFGVTLAERADVYVTLGAANGRYEGTYEGSKLEFETETGFAWSVGTTILLHEFENGIMLGVDGKYRQADIDVDKVIIDGTTYEIPSGTVTNVGTEYKEWHVAFGVAKQFDMFIPYGGIKYSDVDAMYKVTESGTTYESDSVSRENKVGIFIGCDIVPPDTDNILFNIEGRFIDETALSVTATMKF